MEDAALAELLFPNVTATPEEIEEKYPKRDLPEGAKVTRIAPSPTGFMHLGNLFGALTDERLAHQSGGVFYLRIEDTDLKRQVEGGVEKILDVFHKFGLRFDEGALENGGEFGNYAPTDSGRGRRSIMSLPKSSCRRAGPIPASAPRRSLPACASGRRRRRRIPAITASGPSGAAAVLKR